MLGELDIAITTDFETPDGARRVAIRRVGWVTAQGSGLAQRRPVPLAFTKGCVFREKAVASLDAASVPHTMAVESADVRAIEAAVAADRGVHAMIVDALPSGLHPVDTTSGLPALPEVLVNLQIAAGAAAESAELAAELDRAFGGEMP